MGHVRRRKAVSELLGTLIMVAITLVAGFAIFGYVNGQAATSENQYGESVANNVNYLSEHFVIVNVQFANSAGGNCASSGGSTYCAQVSISVYNNGAVDLTIQQLLLKNVTAISAGGIGVPDLFVNATRSSTRVQGYPCTGPGFSLTGGSSSFPIPQNQVPPTVLTFNLPSCVPLTSGILVGASYQVEALGIYGNGVVAQVTASG